MNDEKGWTSWQQSLELLMHYWLNRITLWFVIDNLLNINLYLSLCDRHADIAAMFYTKLFTFAESTHQRTILLCMCWSIEIVKNVFTFDIVRASVDLLESRVRFWHQYHVGSHFARHFKWICIENVINLMEFPKWIRRWFNHDRVFNVHIFASFSVTATNNVILWKTFLKKKSPSLPCNMGTASGQKWRFQIPIDFYLNSNLCWYASFLFS